MTSSPQIAACDFTKPRQLTGTANRAVSSWLSTACALLKENWQSLLGCVQEIHVDRVDSSVASSAVRTLPDPAFAARIQVGPDGFDALVSFPEPVVLAFVADMLGTPGETWPERRPLTPAETSMVELLLGEVARAMSQAWPEISPLECLLHSVVERPVRSRVYGPETDLVRATLAISTSLGDQTAVLLLPRSGLHSIGIAEQALAEESPTVPPGQLRHLAERLPVTVTVSLGSTTLTLAELNGLTPGDVLVLDQRISTPLQAAVSGRMFWKGMPCRLGQRQAFRITESHTD